MRGIFWLRWCEYDEYDVKIREYEKKSEIGMWVNVENKIKIGNERVRDSESIRRGCEFNRSDLTSESLSLYLQVAKSVKRGFPDFSAQLRNPLALLKHRIDANGEDSGVK